jgi:hypothetical protein
MEQALFNPEGEPIPYISDELNRLIFLWDGHPVAYLDGYRICGFRGTTKGREVSTR